MRRRRSSASGRPTAPWSTLARRDALAGGLGDGLGLVMTGVTVTGVLAVAATAASDGRLDRVLIAMLTLLALASFEAVTPLSAAVRELSAGLAAGRRILELTDRVPEVQNPSTAAPPPGGRSPSSSNGSPLVTPISPGARLNNSACD